MKWKCVLTAMFQFEGQVNTSFFFSHKPEKSATVTPVTLNLVSRDDTLTKSTVYNWYNQFKSSQVLLEDEHSSRPSNIKEL